MSVALRGVSPSVDYTFATSLEIATPAGVVPGDHMLMQVFLEDTTLVPESAGWTLLQSIPNPNTFTLTIFRKRYEGEAGPYAVTWGGANLGHGALLAAWSGVSTSAPVNAHNGKASEASSQTILAPSVTTTVGNCMIVLMGDCNTPNTFSKPAGMEKVIEAEGIISQVLQPGAGPSGTRAAHLSSASWNTVFLVALAPRQTNALAMLL